MEYDATHFVTNEKELLLKINASLINKDKKHSNQIKFKKDFITYTDGKSGERIAQSILNLLENKN